MLRYAFYSAALLAVPHFAYAQTVEVDANSLLQRFDRLEKRLMAMEGRMFNDATKAQNIGSTALNDTSYAAAATPNTVIRLQELEDESSALYGSVEKLGYSVELLVKRLDKFAEDVEIRLQDLEKTVLQQQANPITSARPLTQAQADPVIIAQRTEDQPRAIPIQDIEQMDPNLMVPENISAEELYQKAYGFLTAAAYPNAEIWLNTFIKRYPNHELADNAYYWLGEVHLVQKKPQQAIMAFKTGLQKFPKGSKAPANMLKMGTAFIQLEQPQFAKTTWNKLIADYPDAIEVDKAKEELKKLGA